MNIQDYIKPDLIVLIPVLYIIGSSVKKSRVADRWQPLIIILISVLLSSLWVFSTCQCDTWQHVLTALFTSITQGVLIASSSVYLHQIVYQFRISKPNAPGPLQNNTDEPQTEEKQQPRDTKEPPDGKQQNVEA